MFANLSGEPLLTRLDDVMLGLPEEEIRRRYERLADRFTLTLAWRGE